MPAVAHPVLSVLIASYGSAAYIEAAIRSVLCQTLVDLEVLVIDDVSLDDSIGIVAKLALGDARIRLVKMQTNGGPAAARNLGLTEARGKWIAIMDSDDLLAPDRLATLVEAAETRGYDIIADNLMVFSDGLPESAVPLFSEKNGAVAMRDLSLQEYLRHSGVYRRKPSAGFLKPVIRRDRWLATGVRYDERLRVAEDDDLIIKLLVAGLRYGVLDSAGYFYRKHPKSISHRLKRSVIEAMIIADRHLHEAVTVAHPELSSLCEARSRSYRRALTFESVIQNLKSGRLNRAMLLALTNPSVLPLLGMPLAGLAARVRRRPNATASRRLDEMRILLDRRSTLGRP